MVEACSKLEAACAAHSSRMRSVMVVRQVKAVSHSASAIAARRSLVVQVVDSSCLHGGGRTGHYAAASGIADH